METLTTCPLCGNPSSEKYLESEDFFLTHEPFSICVCKECGFKFTNPRPASSEIGKYYESKEYISHDSHDRNFLNILYTTARTFALKRKVRLVKIHSSGNTILDIGCGTGEFLKECRKEGFDTTGVEPNEKASGFARVINKLKVFPENYLEEIPAATFDVITLWHVLEHVPDLNDRMRTINRILKDDGTLIIAVPNAGSWDAEYYGKFWAAYDLPRHLYHFNIETMNKLARKHEFSILQILPMKMDAFYISLLSEKYLKKKSDYLSAFTNGLRSNRAAGQKTGTSSLIFILKKSFGQNKGM